MFRHVSSDRRTFGLRKTFDETKRRPPRLSSVEPFGALRQCRRPAWSKAAVVNVPATQSAVPLCSRSQTVIAASINTDGVLGTHRSAQSPQTAKQMIKREERMNAGR